MQGCEHLLDGSTRSPTRVRSGGAHSRHDLVDWRVPGEEARGSGPNDALDFIPSRGIILARRNGKGEHPRRGVALEDRARRLSPFEIGQRKTHQRHVRPLRKRSLPGHNRNVDPRTACRGFSHHRPFPPFTIVRGRVSAPLGR
jgi:hypothetical protein